MRIIVEHTGAVDKDDRFSVSLVEVARPNLSVSGGHAHLRFTATERELKDVILRALYALEDARLFNCHHAGGISAEQYKAAILEMDHKGPPVLALDSLLPGTGQGGDRG